MPAQAAQLSSAPAQAAQLSSAVGQAAQLSSAVGQAAQLSSAVGQAAQLSSTAGHAAQLSSAPAQVAQVTLPSAGIAQPLGSSAGVSLVSGNTGVQPQSQLTVPSVQHVQTSEPSLLDRLIREAGLRLQPSDSGSQPSASLRVLSVGEVKGSDAKVGVGEEGDALLDSGATHALRPPNSGVEWDSSTTVAVQLAGSQTTDLKMSAKGSLLLPEERSGSRPEAPRVIVPLGQIIQKLGYRLEWTASVCRLISPSGRAHRLRVKSGCPHLCESEALALIARLEEKGCHQLHQ